MPNLIKAKVEGNFAALSLDTDKRYAVAYSGGPDSTFLLDCLYSIGFKNIVVIYINYHDTNRVDIEEKIVKETSERMNYELHNYNVNIREIIAKNNLNFEDSARKIRYQIFREEYDEKPFECILVAHQKDDLIETYLMQQSRKNLVDYWGISPISYINGIKVVRPLLNITKSEIVKYLHYQDIPFFEDYSNKDLNHQRNFIRAKKLPTIDKDKIMGEIVSKNQKLLKQINKLEAIDASTTKYSRYLRLTKEEKLRYLYMKIFNSSKMSTSIKTLVAARNLAYENLKKANVTGSLKLCDNVYLYRNYQSFYIHKIIKTHPYSMRIDNPILVQGKNFRMDLTDYKKFNLKLSDFPITIRPYKPDDVFGTNIKGNSVKKFIKNNKVPQYLRPIYPVIINKQGNIVFVPFYDDVKKKKIPLKFKSFKLN